MKETRPETSICRVCHVEYKLDYTDEDKYGDELRPVLNYCPEHSSTKGTHPYPFI